MKIKQSELESLIKEELKTFVENHGEFPVEETIADECSSNKPINKVQQIYKALTEQVGHSQLKLIFESLVKQHNIKL